MVNKCTHPKEHQSIVVTETFAGFEITRVKCSKCNEFITPPKHD